VRYNVRKLCELPHHLVESGMDSELRQYVLFNYDWLHSKLSATSLPDVLADFHMATNAFRDADKVQLTQTIVRILKKLRTYGRECFWRRITGLGSLRLGDLRTVVNSLTGVWDRVSIKKGFSVHLSLTEHIWCNKFVMFDYVSCVLNISVNFTILVVIIITY